MTRLQNVGYLSFEPAYAEAGLEVESRYVPREEVASVQSAWAKKLAYSGSERAFVEIRGTVVR